MRPNHKDNRQRALRLLGLHPEKKLNFRERFARDAITQALDYGATFASPEAAQQFVRLKWSETFWLILVIGMLAAFFMVLNSGNAAHGYTDGYKTGLEVCKIIIARG